MQKKTITITMAPDIIQQAKTKAQQENRTFSNYLSYLVIKDTEYKDRLIY